VVRTGVRTGREGAGICRWDGGLVPSREAFV